MTLHTKYQGSRPYGFRQEDFIMYSLYKPCKHVIPGVVQLSPKEHNMNKLGGCYIQIDIFQLPRTLGFVRCSTP